MPCGWEGNRRSGVALAMRHRLQWFIQLWAHGLRKGDEHPAYTPHGVWHFFYSILLSTPLRPPTHTRKKLGGDKRLKCAPSSRLIFEEGRTFYCFCPQFPLAPKRLPIRLPKQPASEMTYIMSGGALNSTQTKLIQSNCRPMPISCRFGDTA